MSGTDQTVKSPPRSGPLVRGPQASSPSVSSPVVFPLRADLTAQEAAVASPTRVNRPPRTGNRAILVLNTARQGISLPPQAAPPQPIDMPVGDASTRGSPNRVLLAEKLQGRTIITADASDEAKQRARELGALSSAATNQVQLITKRRRLPAAPGLGSESATTTSGGSPALHTRTGHEAGQIRSQIGSEHVLSTSTSGVISDSAPIRDAFTFGSSLSLSPNPPSSMDEAEQDDGDRSPTSASRTATADFFQQPPLAQAAAARAAEMRQIHEQDPVGGSYDDDLIPEPGAMFGLASSNSPIPFISGTSRPESPMIVTKQPGINPPVTPQPPGPLEHIEARFTPPPAVPPKAPTGNPTSITSESSLRSRRRAHFPQGSTVPDLISSIDASDVAVDSHAQLVGLKRFHRPTAGTEPPTHDPDTHEDTTERGFTSKRVKTLVDSKRSQEAEADAKDSTTSEGTSNTPKKAQKKKACRKSDPVAAPSAITVDLAEGDIEQSPRPTEITDAQSAVREVLADVSGPALRRRRQTATTTTSTPLPERTQTKSARAALFTEEEGHATPAPPTVLGEQSLTTARRRRRTSSLGDASEEFPLQQHDPATTRLVFDEALDSAVNEATACEHAQVPHENQATPPCSSSSTPSDRTKEGDRPRWRRTATVSELKGALDLTDLQQFAEPATSAQGAVEQVAPFRRAAQSDGTGRTTTPQGSRQLQQALEEAERIAIIDSRNEVFAHQDLSQLLSRGQWVYPGLFPIFEPDPNAKEASPTTVTSNASGPDPETGHPQQSGFRIGYRLDYVEHTSAKSRGHSDDKARKDNGIGNVFGYVADTVGYFPATMSARAHAQALALVNLNRNLSIHYPKDEGLGSAQDSRNRRDAAMLLIRTASAPPAERLAALVRVASIETRRLHAALEAYVAAQSRAYALLHAQSHHPQSPSQPLSLTTASPTGLLAPHALRRIVFGFKSVLFPELAATSPQPNQQKGSLDHQGTAQRFASGSVVSIIDDSGFYDYSSGYEETQAPLRFQILRVLTDDASSLNNGAFTLCLASVQQYVMQRRSPSASPQHQEHSMVSGHGSVQTHPLSGVVPSENLALTRPRLCQLLIPNSLGSHLTSGGHYARQHDPAPHPGDVLSVFWPWFTLPSPFLDIAPSKSDEADRAVAPLQVFTAVLYTHHDFTNNLPVRPMWKSGLQTDTTNDDIIATATAFSIREASKYFERLRLRQNLPPHSDLRAHADEVVEMSLERALLSQLQNDVALEEPLSLPSSKASDTERMSSTPLRTTPTTEITSGLVATPSTLVECRDPGLNPRPDGACLASWTLTGLLLKVVLRPGETKLYLFQPPDITASQAVSPGTSHDLPRISSNEWSSTWLSLAAASMKHPSLVMDRATQRRLHLSRPDAPSSAIVAIVLPYSLMSGNESHEDTDAVSGLREIVSFGEGSWVSIRLHGLDGRSPLSMFRLSRKIATGRTSRTASPAVAQEETTCGSSAEHITCLPSPYDAAEADQMSSLSLPHELVSRLVHLGLALTVYKGALQLPDFTRLFPEIADPHDFPYAARVVRITSPHKLSFECKRDFNAAKFSHFPQLLARAYFPYITFTPDAGKMSHSNVSLRVFIIGKVRAFAFSSIPSYGRVQQKVRPTLFLQTVGSNRLLHVLVKDPNLDRTLSAMLFGNPYLIENYASHVHPESISILSVQDLAAKALKTNSEPHTLTNLDLRDVFVCHRDGLTTLEMDDVSEIVCPVHRGTRVGAINRFPQMDQQTSQSQENLGLLPFVIGIKAIGTATSSHKHVINFVQTSPLASTHALAALDSNEGATTRRASSRRIRQAELTSSLSSENALAETPSEQTPHLSRIPHSLLYLERILRRKNPSRWLELYRHTQAEVNLDWPWVISLPKSSKEQNSSSALHAPIHILCLAPVCEQPERILTLECSKCGQDILATAPDPENISRSPASLSTIRDPYVETLSRELGVTSTLEHAANSITIAPHFEATILDRHHDNDEDRLRTVLREFRSEEREAHPLALLQKLEASLSDEVLHSISVDGVRKCPHCESVLMSSDDVCFRKRLKVLLRCEFGPNQGVSNPEEPKYLLATALLEDAALSYVLLTSLLLVQTKLEDVQHTSLPTSACIGVMEALLSLHRLVWKTRCVGPSTSMAGTIPSAALFLPTTPGADGHSDDSQLSITPRFGSPSSIALHFLPQDKSSRLQRLSPILQDRPDPTSISCSNTVSQTDTQGSLGVSTWPDLNPLVQALEELCSDVCLTHKGPPASTGLVISPLIHSTSKLDAAKDEADHDDLLSGRNETTDETAKEGVYSFSGLDASESSLLHALFSFQQVGANEPSALSKKSTLDVSASMSSSNDEVASRPFQIEISTLPSVVISSVRWSLAELFARS